MKSLLAILFCVFAVNAFATGSHRISGHVTKKGTYVAPMVSLFATATTCP